METDDAKLDEVVGLIEDGLFPRQAARKAGLDESTWQNCLADANVSARISTAQKRAATAMERRAFEETPHLWAKYGPGRLRNEGNAPA